MRGNRLAFNGGELSDWLAPRLDLGKFQSGCEILANMRVVRYGGATSRPGTLYVAETKDSTDRAILQGFDFGRTVSNVLEFGDQYFRVFNSQAGTQVTVSASAWLTSTAYAVNDAVTQSGTTYVCTVAHTSGTFATDLAAGKWYALSGSIYEVQTPYLVADIYQLQFTQRNDVIIITHPDYAPRILTRNGHADWTLDLITWDHRPYGDLNSTSTTLTPSAKTGTGITLTASDDLFTAAWVGSRIKIIHKRDPVNVQTSMSDTRQGIATSALASTSYAVGDTIQYTAGGGYLYPLYTCIATYTHGTDYTGSADPSTYPTFFEPGIIAQVAISGGGFDTMEYPEVTGGGTWTFETAGTWYGEWAVERSYDAGTSWVEVYSITSEGNANAFEEVEESTDVNALLRLRLLRGTFAYTSSVTLTAEASDAYGEAVVTAYTSATEVDADVERDFEKVLPSQLWAEDEFNPRMGYPATATFHEARLFFGGTTAQPSKIWGSRSDDYFDFTPGTDATSPVTYDLTGTRSYSAIRWLLSHRSLLVGTEAGTWSSATTDGGPISGEGNAQFYLQDDSGAESLPAMVVNNAALFIQRSARKLMELSGLGNEFGGYEAVDLTQLAEHVTKGGIEQATKRKSPDTTIDCVTGDGIIAGMVYERSEQVSAWHRWVTDGAFESVAATYGADEEDELWTIVNRTIDGATVRYVERFVPDMMRTVEDYFGGDADKIDDFVFVDCAVAGTQSASVTISGLDHLEGETVQILADGAVHGEKTVASGAITLDVAVADYVVGLAFTPEVRPMPPGNTGDRTSFSRCRVLVRATMDAEVSQDRSRWSRLQTPGFRNNANAALRTGWQRANVPGNFAEGQSLSVRQANPLPLTVLAITFDKEGGTD